MSASATKSIINALAIMAGISVLGIMLYFAMKDGASGNLGSVIPAGSAYTQNICDNAYETEVNYQKQNPPYIDVKLADKCFSGFITLPAKWGAWQSQFLGSDPADWVAAWGAGVAIPDPPQSQQQVNSQTTRIHVPQNKLRLEGKGMLRFYRITGEGEPTPLAVNGKPSTTEPTEGHLEGAPVPLGPPPPPKVYHPVLPTSGENAFYSMQIQECARNGERIDCWGFMKNNTNEPIEVHLARGEAVDDLGNSTAYSGYNSTWAFDSGEFARLIPTRPTKFHILVRDSHPEVKTLDFDCMTTMNDAKNEFVFKDVPVEQ